MLVSLNWLKNYVDYGSLSPEQLGELITKSGIEVDGISRFSETSKNVIVGYIESCDQHPNADKLSLCQVDVGEETLQIICGAPNVAQGQKVAVAKPGAVLPGDFKIKKVKLRGIESNGMICSLQELGINDKYIPTDVSDGIFVFPDEVEIGQNVDTLLNLNDSILEFDLTPNRSDSLSMLGVAYEVSAILDIPITIPNVSVETIEEKSNDYVSVQVENSKLAPYYGAFIVKDIEIKPSPLWMRNYLIASGIRPINNVVDITNYVLLEYGQPLHAFDYDRIQTNQILVRAAKENETIETLDGKERKLSTDHLVITNGKKPIALAGVMGGANTEVYEHTSTILLEAAYFHSASVRKTVLDTGLRSESSTRFEKGVDPNRVEEAGLRACQLLQKYANGKVLSNPVIFDELDRKEKLVNINTNEINKRLGTEISSEEIEQILKKLQFSYELTQNEFKVSIPTRRGDVEIFEDMVEEIARIYGYDRLPYTLPANSSRPGALSNQQRLKRKIKQYLQSVGLTEAITYSLTNKGYIENLISPELEREKIIPVTLAMPMSEDHKYLRLSLLPELLQSLSYNRARAESNIAYYEMGSVFISTEKQLTKQPEERLRLAGALTGMWMDHKWRQDNKKIDFYVMKGILEGLFTFLELPLEFKQARHEDLHPGRSAFLYIDDHLIGFAGQLHPMCAQKMGLKETFVFDLNMETVLSLYDSMPTYEKTPRYPSITRDIAFVVDNSVFANDILKAIETSDIPYVKNIEIFDVYQGENLEENQKSIAYSIHFQHSNKTLTDEMVDKSFDRIVGLISTRYNASIRS